MKRHYVFNQKTFDILKQGILAFKQAIFLSKKYHFDFLFGLKLTVDESSCPPHLLQTITQELTTLPPEVLLLYESKNYGPQSGFYEVFFKLPYFLESLVAYSCLDQFPMSSFQDLSSLQDAIYPVLLI